jgi:hypothetical protein
VCSDSEHSPRKGKSTKVCTDGDRRCQTHIANWDSECPICDLVDAYGQTILGSVSGRSLHPEVPFFFSRLAPAVVIAQYCLRRSGGDISFVPSQFPVRRSSLKLVSVCNVVCACSSRTKPVALPLDPCSSDARSLSGYRRVKQHHFSLLEPVIRWISAS